MSRSLRWLGRSGGAGQTRARWVAEGWVSPSAPPFPASLGSGPRGLGTDENTWSRPEEASGPGLAQDVCD